MRKEIQMLSLIRVSFKGKGIICNFCAKPDELASNCPLKQEILMKNWYIKTGKEIHKDNRCQETSDVGEETQEEQNNEQERSHTQVGWSMHQSAYSIMSDDDTASVSGYDDYYSDLDDSDSLPESVLKLFTDDSNFNEIDTDDERSDEDDLPTLIPT